MFWWSNHGHRLPTSASVIKLFLAGHWLWTRGSMLVVFHCRHMSDIESFSLVWCWQSPYFDARWSYIYIYIYCIYNILCIYTIYIVYIYIYIYIYICMFTVHIYIYIYSVYIIWWLHHHVWWLNISVSIFDVSIPSDLRIFMVKSPSLMVPAVTRPLRQLHGAMPSRKLGHVPGRGLSKQPTFKSPMEVGFMTVNILQSDWSCWLVGRLDYDFHYSPKSFSIE